MTDAKTKSAWKFLMGSKMWKEAEAHGFQRLLQPFPGMIGGQYCPLCGEKQTRHAINTETHQILCPGDEIYVDD